MRMSDLITQEILRLLNNSKMNIAEIQRNELANTIGCAPIQINYVLSSRFTPEHGYIIESRRGGGGYILNSIGETIDPMTTRIVIENCLESELVDSKTARLMAAAVSGNAMQSVPVEFRDYLRASVLKHMLLSLI